MVMTSIFDLHEYKNIRTKFHLMNYEGLLRFINTDLTSEICSSHAHVYPNTSMCLDALYFIKVSVEKFYCKLLELHVINFTQCTFRQYKHGNTFNKAKIGNVIYQIVAFRKLGNLIYYDNILWIFTNLINNNKLIFCNLEIYSQYKEFADVGHKKSHRKFVRWSYFNYLSLLR